MAGWLHRTATTTYPCCIPALGRFEGAGRTGLTRRESKYSVVKKNFLTYFSFLIWLLLPWPWSPKWICNSAPRCTMDFCVRHPAFFLFSYFTLPVNTLWENGAGWVHGYPSFLWFAEWKRTAILISVDQSLIGRHLEHPTWLHFQTQSCYAFSYSYSEYLSEQIWFH